MAAKRHIERAWNGLTVVEIVIVLLIVAIMASVAGPRFADAMSQLRVDEAARRIKTDFELARRRAKTTSTSQTIQFSTGSHSYALPGVPHLDRLSGDYLVELDQPPYQVTLASVEFGGDDILVFDGFGMPDSGGSVVVRLERYQKRISVDPNTGRAEIQ